MLNYMESVPLFLIVWASTLSAGVMLVLTQRWHAHFSLDYAHGVQKHHKHPTPRIGGLAIVVGLLVAWAGAVPGASAILETTLLAAIPAFVFGLAEDVTKRIGVLSRLLATMFSGVVACYLTGVAMQNTGLPPLDFVLQLMPLAVIFTAFAVGGVANAINIIDGFNGLAAGAVAIMLLVLAWMAYRLGDADLAVVCILLAMCALGFTLVNWPLGKIFLGDGGAYLLGFLLAWMAVLLPMRHLQVSGWSTFLVVAYPVLEVLFSVLRRRKREGHHPGQPDKVHLHHLIHRRIICQRFPNQSVRLKNGLTSPVCWCLVALPAFWAIIFMHTTWMLIVGVVFFTVGYALIYNRLAYFRWFQWSK
jgi:UDP-N-acetylmuramyl pentapeptide phosphotransferase/UDP-N-acetylglucosamine-1-phosphate transferase